MQPWLIILLSTIGGILALYLVCAFAFALYADGVIFGKRQQKNAAYKYFSAEELGLHAEPFKVPFGKVQLSGNLCFSGRLEDERVLVIFVHGFGAGSASYTTEISSLVRHGYAVLAYDAYGCNDSPGKSIRSFYSGVRCAVAAFDAACNDVRLKGLKKVFCGHSWGAYSALCAAGKTKVDGVVALSAFDSPVVAVVDAIGAAAGRRAKELAALSMPMFWLINFLKSGAKANARAAVAATKSGVKCLLVHGERDVTVPLSNSAARHAQGANVTSVLLRDKGHNPYNTVEAERILSSLFAAKFVSEDEKQTFFSKFDWKQATKEDDAVMGAVCDFIDAI